MQLALRSGMPRCVCRLANIDEQILPLPFSGLATETCQYQGAGVIVALQRDVLSVKRPALKSPSLLKLANTGLVVTLPVLEQFPLRRGRGVACALQIQGEAGLSLKLADQGPMLEGVLEK